MEDIEDSDSGKDEVQLGRLHFSMDYDFTKSEVDSSRCRYRMVNKLYKLYNRSNNTF